jgi:polyhydroxyalkanoate synthesis regulator phasin
MMRKLDDLVRNFIKSEGMQTKPSVHTYIQSISEIVSSMSPSSLRDRRRLQIVKEHLKEVRKHTRKMQERITILEEQVEILEESK